MAVNRTGGPAGTGAAELTFEVTDKRGEGYGCSSVGPAGAALGLLVVPLVLGIRRRRE